MTFDVDAWLDQAQPPTRAVRIYGRGDLVARLQALQIEAADAPDPDAPVVIDDRLAGRAPQPATDALDAAAQQLLDELEASALVVTVRGLLDQEQRDLLEQATTPGADGKDAVDSPRYEQLLASTALVDPPVTVDQAGKLRQRIGQAQWDALFTAITQASQEPIDVPLSRLGSETGQDS